MGSGWVIIFVFFNQFVDDPIGHSSINQETPVVYQSLKDCNENVMDAARKRNWQKFGVAHYGTTGEDEQRIEITTQMGENEKREKERRSEGEKESKEERDRS